jgi:hypothetical protein
MQAGLSGRRLSLREIFSSVLVWVALDQIVIRSAYSIISVNVRHLKIPLAALQHLMTEAPIWATLPWSTRAARPVHSRTWRLRISRTQEHPL